MIASRIGTAAAGLALASAMAASACSDGVRTATTAPPDAGTDAAEGPRDASAGNDDGDGHDDGGLVVDCPIDTTVEYEDNDTPERANAVEGTAFCGAITPGSDVDFSTFTTPPGKRLLVFQAVIGGSVDFELRTGGKTLRPADTKDFVDGTYVVKAFTTDGKPGKYRYRIQFEP